MHLLRRASYICQRCQRSLDAASKRIANRTNAYSTASTHSRPLRLAIIGSGPAGFYSAHRVLQRLPDARIDMYEALPTPFGLVRFGVAPDHPEVKNCQDKFREVALTPNFTFVGNVPIGSARGSLPLERLAEHYDALLFAFGASKDRTLGIPGEDARAVISARAFVGWYNGLPEYADLKPDLDAGDTAVVIGQGNVALDVTRVLLQPIEELRKTDIADHAVEALSKSRVRRVKVVGRRGPLQAPYTIKELRELMNMPEVGFVSPDEGWDALIQVERKKLPRQLKRIAEVLEKGSKLPTSGAQRTWQLGFMRSPYAFTSTSSGKLESIAFEKTQYVSNIPTVLTGDAPTDLNALRALKVTGSGIFDSISASVAFRSVGYKSEPLEGFTQLDIPFDSKLGILPNDMYGRVISPSLSPGGMTAGHIPGMYAAGWVKRGPTGVIASTMDDAFITGEIIARDWEQGARFMKGDGAGWEGLKDEASRRGVRRVRWEDWEVIDAEEQRRGKEKGKEREKFKSVAEMLKVLDG